MKTRIIFYILFTSVLVFGCKKDDEINISSPLIQPVHDLKYELFSNEDSVRITWMDSNSGRETKTIIRHTDGITILEKGKQSATFGIVETNKEYSYTLKIKDAVENIYSLGQTIHFTRNGAYNISDIAMKQEEDSVLISWKLPSEELGEINISWNSESESGSQKLNGSAKNFKIVGLALDSYSFTFTTKNTGGQSSHTKFQSFRVGPTKVGFLSRCADMAAIVDDDEKAAATWFFNNYNNSAFISFDEIKNGTVDLSQFRVIWWQSDEVGGKDLPAIAKDPTVIQAISDYHKGGGNLLFTVFASYYIQDIGRLPKNDFAEAYNVGDGEGGNNPDVWVLQVKLKAYNYSTHPIYKDMIVNNGEQVPLIGSGWKEDHNCNWGGLPAVNGFANDDDTFVPFLMNKYGITNLASWGGIGDYWQAGLIETSPFGEYKGSAICIGIGAYEWNQNDKVNQYQSQIEKLTENSIEYLKTK